MASCCTYRMSGQEPQQAELGFGDLKESASPSLQPHITDEKSDIVGGGITGRPVQPEK